MSAAPSLSREACAERALVSAKSLQAESNRTAASRLALARVLERTGHYVSLVTIHTWSRQLQGQAYLWAIARLNGVENVPPPWRGVEELRP